MAEFIDYTEIDQYRDRLNRQYGRCSGPEERYPQMVSYIDSRNTKRERRRSKSRSRSRSKSNKYKDKSTSNKDEIQEDEPSNEIENDNDIVEGAVEGVESLLRKKSRSKVCDEFGNLVNKIDYAIYDGEEFQQEKSDTKSLFQRVDEWDGSMGKTTVVSLDTPKRKKKCSSVPRIKANHHNAPDEIPTPKVESHHKDDEQTATHNGRLPINNPNEFSNGESGLNKNEPIKRGMSAITKKLIDGPDTGSNSCNSNTDDVAGNEYSSSKKIHTRLESGRNKYESPTESVRNRMKSPRKPVAVDRNEDIDIVMDASEKVSQRSDAVREEDYSLIQSRLLKDSGLISTKDSNSNSSPNIETKSSVRNNNHLAPPSIPKETRKSRRRKKKHKKKSRAEKTLFELGNPNPHVYNSDSDYDGRKRKKKSKREKGSSFSPTSSVSSGSDVSAETIVEEPSEKVCNDLDRTLPNVSDPSPSDQSPSDQSHSDPSLSDASTDESYRAEGHGCQRSKSESSVCESISARPRKRYKENGKNSSAFGIFRNNRSVSEGRGLFNIVSQTVGNCLTNIAMNHGKYSFPSRQQLYVPDVGMGRNWLRSKTEAKEVQNFFPKMSGTSERICRLEKVSKMAREGDECIDNTKFSGQTCGGPMERTSAMGQTFDNADIEFSMDADEMSMGESVKLHNKCDPVDYREFRTSMENTILNKSSPDYREFRTSMENTILNKGSPVTDDTDGNMSFNKASTQVIFSDSSDDSLFGPGNRQHHKKKQINQHLEYPTKKPRKARSRHARKRSDDDVDVQHVLRDFDHRRDRKQSRDRKTEYNSLDDHQVSDIRDFPVANPTEEFTSSLPPKQKSTVFHRPSDAGRDVVELCGADTSELSSNMSARRRTRYSSHTESSSRLKDVAHQQQLEAWDSRRHRRRSSRRRRAPSVGEDFIHVSNVSRSNRRALPSHLRPDMECPVSSRRGKRLSIDTSMVVDDLGFVFECVDLTQKQKNRLRKHHETCRVENEHKKRTLRSSRRKHYYVCQSFSSIETISQPNKRSMDYNGSPRSCIRFADEEQKHIITRTSPTCENDCPHEYTSNRRELDRASDSKCVSNEMSDHNDKDTDNYAPPSCIESILKEKTVLTGNPIEKSVSGKETPSSQNNDIYNDLLNLKKDVDRLSGLSESLLAERRENLPSTPSEREDLGSSFVYREDKVHEKHGASPLCLSRPPRDVTMPEEYLELEISSQTEIERSPLTIHSESKTKATSVGIYRGNVKVFTTPGGSEWPKHESEKSGVSSGSERHTQEAEKTVVFEQPDNVRYIEMCDRKRTLVKSGSTVYTASAYSNRSTAEDEIIAERKTMMSENGKQSNGFCESLSHNALFNESLNDNRSSSSIQRHSFDRNNQSHQRIRQRTHSVCLRGDNQQHASENENRRIYDSKFLEIENASGSYEDNEKYSMNFIDTFDQMVIPEQPVPVISKEIGYSKKFIQGCMSRLSENSTSNNKFPKVFNKPHTHTDFRNRRINHVNEFFKEKEGDLSSISKYSCRESSAKTSIHSNFKKKKEMKCFSDKYQQNTVSFDLDNQEVTSRRDGRQLSHDSDDLFLSKNQNSSLCTPMNLNHFKRDVFYPQVAYNCSMSTSLSKRLSISEENLLSTKTEGANVNRKIKPHCSSAGDDNEKFQEADSGEDISLSSMSANCGDGHYSKRFLLFSNNMASWQAWSKSWIGKLHHSCHDNKDLRERCTREIEIINSQSCTISPIIFKKSKRCCLTKTRNEPIDQRSKSMPRQYISEFRNKKHGNKKPKSIKKLNPCKLSCVPTNVDSTRDNSQISSIESNTSTIYDEDTYSNSKTKFVQKTSDLMESLTVVPNSVTQYNSNVCHDSSAIVSTTDGMSCQNNQSKQGEDSPNTLKSLTSSLDDLHSEMQFSNIGVSHTTFPRQESNCCYSSGTDSTSPVRSVKRPRFRATEDAGANLSTNRCDSGHDTADCRNTKKNKDTAIAVGEITDTSPKQPQSRTWQKPTLSLNSQSLPVKVTNTTCTTFTSPVVFIGSSDDEADYDGIEVSYCSNVTENNSNAIDPPSVRSLLDGKLKIVYDEESNKWFPGPPNQTFRTRHDKSGSCKYSNDCSDQTHNKQTSINIDYDSAPGRIQSKQGTSGKDCSFYAWFRERVSKDLSSYTHSESQILRDFACLLPKYLKRNANDRNMSKSEEESSESESFICQPSKFRKRRRELLRNGRHRSTRRHRRGSHITLSTTSLMSHLSQSLKDSNPEIFQLNHENQNEVWNNKYGYDLGDENNSENKPMRTPVNSFSSIMGIGRLVNKMAINSPEYRKEISPERLNVPRALLGEHLNDSYKQILAPIIEESYSDQNIENGEKINLDCDYAEKCSYKYATVTFNECCDNGEPEKCTDDFAYDSLIPNEKDRSCNKADFSNIHNELHKQPENLALRCSNDPISIYTAESFVPELNKFDDLQENRQGINFDFQEHASPNSGNGRSSYFQNECEYKSDFMKNEVREYPKSFSNQKLNVYEYAGVKNAPSMYLGGYGDSTRHSPDSYYYNPWTSKHMSFKSGEPLRYRSLQSDSNRLYSRRYTQSASRDPMYSFSRSFHHRYTPHNMAYSKFNNSGTHLNLNRTCNCALDAIKHRYSPEPIHGCYFTDNLASRNCNQNANNGDDKAARNSGTNIGASSKSQTTTCSEFKWDQTLRKDSKTFQASQSGKRDSVQMNACKSSRYSGSAAHPTADISDTYAMSNKFALCAGKNINGSGNMVGSLPHYGQVSQSLGYPVSAEELRMARQDDVTPPDDLVCEIDALSDTLVVEPCSGFEASGGRDVTCNHPSTSSRYIGVPRNVSRDDIRMKLSPCCQQNDVYRKHSDHTRQSYQEGQRYKYSDTFRKIKENYLVGSQTCIAVPSTQGLDIRRTFGGQGDTHPKRGFTEWYVTDERVGDTGIPVDVQPRRERSASPNVHKSDRSSEGSIGSMESFSSSTCSSNCSVRDVEERADDVSQDEAEDSKESSEYEFDDIEQIEVEEGSEVDDDEWEDDSEEEVEDGDPRCCAVSYAVMTSREARNAVKDMTTMKTEICHNCGCDGQNMTHNKHDSMMDVDPSEKLRRGIAKICKGRGEPHAEEKVRKEHQSKAYANQRYEDKDPFPKGRAKSKSLSKRFSFDQIKVPSIEKERVRFACSEKGEWAEIGRGSYGCVYLGLLDGSVEVAIKDFYESSSWDLVIHEARMLLFLQETGITPAFYGLRRRFNETKEPSEYCIIMEYFGDGRTLFNVMSDKILLAPEEWLDVVGQLVAGLRLIHSKQVLINDLKADNILIDLSSGRKTIRYIDVGMATYKQGLTFQLPSDQMNKYNFLAPEVREGAHTSTKSDIYSLGYMLDQIMRLAGPALAGLDKLVARCLDKDPANRPDIDEIVSQVHWYIVTKSHTRDVSPRAQVFACNSV